MAPPRNIFVDLPKGQGPTKRLLTNAGLLLTAEVKTADGEDLEQWSGTVELPPHLRCTGHPNRCTAKLTFTEAGGWAKLQTCETCGMKRCNLALGKSGLRLLFLSATRTAVYTNNNKQLVGAVYTEEDGTFGYVSNGATLSSAQQLSWTHLTRQNDATVAATIKAVPGSSSASSSSAAVGGNQLPPLPIPAGAVPPSLSVTAVPWRPARPPMRRVPSPTPSASLEQSSGHADLAVLDGSEVEDAQVSIASTPGNPQARATRSFMDETDDSGYKGKGKGRADMPSRASGGPPSDAGFSGHGAGSQPWLGEALTTASAEGDENGDVVARLRLLLEEKDGKIKDLERDLEEMGEEYDTLEEEQAFQLEKKLKPFQVGLVRAAYEIRDLTLSQEISQRLLTEASGGGTDYVEQHRLEHAARVLTDIIRGCQMAVMAVPPSHVPHAALLIESMRSRPQPLVDMQGRDLHKVVVYLAQLLEQSNAPNRRLETEVASLQATVAERDSEIATLRRQLGLSLRTTDVERDTVSSTIEHDVNSEPPVSRNEADYSVAADLAAGRDVTMPPTPRSSRRQQRAAVDHSTKSHKALAGYKRPAAVEDDDDGDDHDQLDAQRDADRERGHGAKRTKIAEAAGLHE